MIITRRRFLQTTAAAAASVTASSLLPHSARRVWADEADQKLRILILGGTGFLGPHTVERAVSRGHTLTLFNRGKSNPHLFPDLEKLKGDRDGDLKALEGREWDVVIDTSGYVPRLVDDSASLLKDHVDHYIFISSISVYADESQNHLKEDAPLAELKDPTVETVDGETYGPLKAACEHAAAEAMGGRAVSVRPGLIVGPMDKTDRFTYWPVRVAKGGEVLSPGSPEDPIQFIDVRDLANFIVECAERKHRGAFNATSTDGVHTIGSLLEACKEVSGSDATFTWADWPFLEAQQVMPWSDMPVWVPPGGPYSGLARVSTEAATDVGLQCRPRHETIQATLDWWAEQPEERQSLRAGIAPEREAEVLAAWHARG